MMAVASMGVPSGISSREATYAEAVQAASPGNYEPRGHKYIVDFEYEPVFTLTYRVGGVVLKKEILMVHNEAQLMIRYTLEDAHSETYLRLKPFLAYRNVHALSKANMMANTKFDHVENGIRSKLYVGFPALNMQLSMCPRQCL